jgi:hypothetical protein
VEAGTSEEVIGSSRFRVLGSQFVFRFGSGFVVRVRGSGFDVRYAADQRVRQAGIGG